MEKHVWIRPLVLLLLGAMTACSGSNEAANVSQQDEWGAPYGATSIVIQTGDTPELAFDRLLQILRRRGYAILEADRRLRTVDTDFLRIDDQLWVGISAEITSGSPARIQLYGNFNNNRAVTNEREGLGAAAWDELHAIAASFENAEIYYE